jgi:hypothetical protein
VAWLVLVFDDAPGWLEPGGGRVGWANVTEQDFSASLERLESARRRAVDPGVSFQMRHFENRLLLCFVSPEGSRSHLEPFVQPIRIDCL